jgi:hypothetical protein
MLVDAKVLLQEGEILFGFGKGVLLSSGAVLLVSILLLISPLFQKLALKKEKDVKDISKSIYFLLLIVGVLFVSSLYVYL